MQSLPDGYQYPYTDWPLHVTLADVFAIGLAGQDVVGKLAAFASQQKPFTTTAGQDTFFGPNGETRVTLIDMSPELLALHNNLIDLLEDNGVVFNVPEYTRAGFLAHATVGSHGRLQQGDTVRFDSLTLIDMFPDQDPYQRKVLGTYTFVG